MYFASTLALLLRSAFGASLKPADINANKNNNNNNNRSINLNKNTSANSFHSFINIIFSFFLPYAIIHRN